MAGRGATGSVGTTRGPPNPNFSPVLGLRFNSRAQAKRFVARLEQCGGDEEAAIADFTG